MKINFFTDSYGQTNGVTTTIDAWVEELESRGHEVTTIHPGQSSDSDIGIQSLPGFSIGEEYELGLPFKTLADSEIPEADVVHTHGQFTMGLLGARVAERDDAVHVATHHTPVQHYTEYLRNERAPELLNDTLEAAADTTYSVIEKLAYQEKGDLLYPAPDTLTAPTSDAAERLEERVDRRVETLSNGINTEFYSPQEEPVVMENNPEEVDVDTTEPVIGYCGRIGWEKNLDELATLAESYEGEVVVAGGGGASQEIIPELKDAGVKYLGWLEDDMMPDFYSEIDILVQPSIVETQGKTVLEANACGTPAVGADALALQETIQEGVNGFRYEPGNTYELEQEINKALETSLEPRKFVKDNHSIEATIDRLEQLYQETR